MGVQEVGRKSPKDKSMGEWRVGGARSRRSQVEIQKAARMGRSHGGVRAGDTRGPTDGDDAGGVGAQVGAEQGDIEDPEGLGGARGSGE